MDPPFSVRRLAQRWGCSPQHVYNLIRSKKLTSFRIGGLIRIAAAEVERFECGSNGIEESGTPSGPRTERRDGSRFAPQIVALPNSASRT